MYIYRTALGEDSGWVSEIAIHLFANKMKSMPQWQLRKGNTKKTMHHYPLLSTEGNVDGRVECCYKLVYYLMKIEQIHDNVFIKTVKILNPFRYS